MIASNDYDIAVVGGGIAGLYCCLYAPTGAKVALFEASSRLGGKVETVNMEGFLAEYGSMRFDPIRQPRMGKLIRELELETTPFHEYNSPSTEHRQMVYHLEEGERSLNPLELMMLAIQRVLNMSEENIMSLTQKELERIRREGKYRGNFLWRQGLWNVFSDVISYDATKYMIMDASFFHFIHENPNVADWMMTWIKMLQMSKHLKGIKTGMQSIIDKIQEKLAERGVPVYRKHILRSLIPSDGGYVTLIFGNGLKFSTKQVILALPSHPLKAIDTLPKNIRALLDSVIEIPLLKCFFVVRDPWWQENIPNREVPWFPAREIHYYKQNSMGNVMVYADRPYSHFWSKYVTSKYHDAAELDCNKELPQVFAKQMKIPPEHITRFGIRDWGRDPYGAACPP
jgi:phytoene dehydrogenase-like protein